MNELITISLILPAYNEAKIITNTIMEAVDYFVERQISHEIIVSADGNDGTREIVSELGKSYPGIHAIGSHARSGKGKGIRNAVSLAKGKWIGFADADNKTPIDDLDKVIPYLEQGFEIVIGSRADKMLIEHPQPLYRRIGSKGFGIFMHVVTGLWEINDTQCGFKFFQAAVAKDLFACQHIDGYMFDVEILYLAKLAGYKIEQVPIRWHDDGDSRLNLISGNIRNVIDIFRICLNNSDFHKSP